MKKVMETNILCWFLLIKAKKMTKYEELWNKIRNSIRSITNNSGNYDKKYMKIRFNGESDYFYIQLHEGNK